jgi:hypothetical protein
MLVLWFLAGGIMLIQAFRYRSASESLDKELVCLYKALPLLIGMVLIFFGVYLIKLGKVIETVVELFLGVLVFIYSIQRLKGIKLENLLINGLLLIALGVTLGYIVVF